MKVDRAYLYFFDDKDEPQVHGSSGLTRHGKPKPSFYAVSQLYRILGDYRFERIIKSTEQLHLFEFSKKIREIIYVGWHGCPLVSDPIKQSKNPYRMTEIKLTDLPAKPKQILAMQTSEKAKIKTSFRNLNSILRTFRTPINSAKFPTFQQ